MLFALKSALAATVLATTALAAAITHEPNCLAPRTTAEETKFFVDFASETVAQYQALNTRDTNDTTNGTVINVYMHVIASGATAEKGYVPRKTLLNQLAILNADFAPASIQFRLAGIDWTINASWATDQPAFTDDYRRALRRGTYADLNLYYLHAFDVAHPRGTGYCYLPLPTPPPSSSAALIRDGCYMATRTLPGGDCYGCNLGKITTHEVGHWLGLQHTFLGNCTAPGDGIPDTPAHMMTGGCPKTAPDTCPGVEGRDPIHNHMAYTNDYCRNEFTFMQTLVMKRVFKTMRQGLPEAGKAQASG